MTLASIAGTIPQASSGLPLPKTLPVPWLNLVAKNGGVGSIGLSSVYRVEVAGGEPPATCANITGTTIQTQYSALYAFFGPANSTSPSTVSTSTSTPTTLATVSTPTATLAAASTAPVAGAPCATNGQLACNGSSYRQCVNGTWVIRQCGSGTVCVPDGQSLYYGTAPATTSF
jgi:hypothetical protein